MKDDYKEKSINIFVELNSKMYSIPLDDGEESNVVKGVNIAIDFNKYRSILFTKN